MKFNYWEVISLIIIFFGLGILLGYKLFMRALWNEIRYCKHFDKTHRELKNKEIYNRLIGITWFDRLIIKINTDWR